MIEFNAASRCGEQQVSLQISNLINRICVHSEVTKNHDHCRSFFFEDAVFDSTLTGRQNMEFYPEPLNKAQNCLATQELLNTKTRFLLKSGQFLLRAKCKVVKHCSRFHLVHGIHLWIRQTHKEVHYEYGGNKILFMRPFLCGPCKRFDPFLPSTGDPTSPP